MGGSGDSKIGSCTQVIRSNGEIFAVAHPQKKTGYKSANSETNVRMLGSKTSYKQFYEDEVALPTVTKNPKGMSYRYVLAAALHRALFAALSPRQCRGISLLVALACLPACAMRSPSTPPQLSLFPPCPDRC
jgi:hypothetical protein